MKKYETEFNVIYEELSSYSTLAQISDNSSQNQEANIDLIASLEAENKSLKLQLQIQSDRFKVNHLQMENQEESMLKLYHENKQLKCQVSTLDIEREVILNKLHEKLMNSKFCDES